MKAFPPRAWSVAMPSSAHDLVRRTLAQHGLATDPAIDGSATTGHPQAPEPYAFRDILNRLKPNARTAGAPKPKDANFLDDQFTCAAGSRRFLTYLPSVAALNPKGLIIMLHGCTQNPHDFAAGTKMNERAEEHGFVVVYPHQSRGENAQSCWNWFRRGDQRRDMGEPAILAGLAESVAARHGVPEGKIFVAGLSAGAAMAVILGETYPDVFAAVGAHSGLPAGSAKDVPSAFAAMAGKGTGSLAASGSAVRSIVFHGTADTTVHPDNGHQIVQRLVDHGPRETIQTANRGQVNGRAYSCKVTTNSAGVTLAEHWEIDGLGHAWSGGSANGSYADPAGPDASAEMVRFFLQ